MLIELIKPRRSNSPVTMPDGTSVQFNEDAQGRLTADVPNDQALLILKHKEVFRKVATPPSAVREPEEDAMPELERVLKRGVRKVKAPQE